MTYDAFVASLGAKAPPAGLAAPARALWLDGKGDWAGAHDLLGSDESKDGALVHAYLHRKEGDLGNARYWYRRAGRAPHTGELEEEWAALVRELIGSGEA